MLETDSVCIMTMRNCVYAVLLCSRKIDTRSTSQMSVYRGIFARMLQKESIPPAYVFCVVQAVVMWTAENTAAQLLDFLIIGSDLIGVFHKIKLNLCAVDMPEHIHNHGLCAAAVHYSDNMKDSDWLIHSNDDQLLLF